MIIDPVMDHLEHFGVKGMHWGVRKQRMKNPGHPDHQAVADLRKMPLHELSNQQLKQLNERRNLETNFQRLNPKSGSKAKATAGAILGTATLGVTAFNIINSPFGEFVSESGKKFLETSLGLAVRGIRAVN